MMGFNAETMDTITKIVYLFASVMFILGLKKLSSPKTARTGNFYALIGMLLAIVITLLDQGILDFTYIIACMHIILKLTTKRWKNAPPGYFF